jgi:predicted SAM-dependent methyltransferase
MASVWPVGLAPTLASRLQKYQQSWLLQSTFNDFPKKENLMDYIMIFDGLKNTENQKKIIKYPFLEILMAYVTLGNQVM